MGYRRESVAEYMRRYYYSANNQERISKKSLECYHAAKWERENRPTKLQGFNYIVDQFKKQREITK